MEKENQQEPFADYVYGHFTLVWTGYPIIMQVWNRILIDCSQSPIFPCDRRCGSLSSMSCYLGPLNNASETGESTKCPWVGVVEGMADGKNIFPNNIFPPPHPTLITPPPLPKCNLFSSQFRSHQETKMAARSNWTIRHLRSHEKIGDCEQSRILM